MKRNLLSIFLVVMVIFAFSACTTDTTDTTAATSTTSDTVTTTEETDETAAATETPSDQLGFDPYDEPVTISFISRDLTSFDRDSTIEGRESMQDNVWIDAYSEYLNINIERTVAEDAESLNALLNTMMASGDLPDIVLASSDMYYTLKQNEVLADLSDEFSYAMENYAYLSQLVDTYSDDEVYYCLEDGQMFGLPYLCASAGAEQVLWLRQDWLDAIDMEAPTTIDELVEVATAAVDAGLGGDNGYGIGHTGLLLEDFITGYGVVLGTWVEQDDGAYVYSDTLTDQVSEPLLKLQEMYADGLLRADFVNSDTNSDVTNGLVGIVYGPSWYGATAIDANFENDENADWIAVHLPSVTGEMMPERSSMSTGMICMVTSECEYPDAMFKILNFETFVCHFDEEQLFSSELHITDDGYEIWDLRLFRYFVRGDIGFELYEQVRSALLAGETDASKYTDATFLKLFNAGIATQNGDRTLMGLNAVMFYGNIICKELYDNGLFVYKYSGDLTENMILYEDTINMNLENAMVDVIMGADISVYEQAVEDWYANGGQSITDDVNNYYASQK